MLITTEMYHIDSTTVQETPVEQTWEVTIASTGSMFVVCCEDIVFGVLMGFDLNNF